MPESPARLAIRGMYGPTLVLLVALSTLGIVSHDLSRALAIWLVALGALLAVSGAFHSHHLEENERTLMGRLLSCEDESGRGSAPLGIALFGIAFFLTMQMWLETGLWLDRHYPAYSTMLSRYAWYGAPLFLASLALLQKPEVLGRRVAGYGLLVVSLVLGNVYSIEGILILFFAAIVLQPGLRKLAGKIKSEYITSRRVECLSPSIYYGLSAIAAGSLWIAFLDAPPVRFWTTP